MLFKNHAATFWKLSIGAAIILFIGIAIWSLITRRQGTWERNLLLPLDSVISPEQRTRDSKQEARVRACLEAIFPNHKFPNVRPDWLVNANTGRALELDCYCEALNFAVEVQGVQHIRPVIGWFHKTGDDFVKQQMRDAAKADICAKRGIHLITIPFNVSEDKTCSFLQRELEKRQLMPKHLTGW